MRFEQYIIHSILDYPDLYKDVDLQHSREKVLDHLFFTNGNGLEWQDGELKYQDTESSEEARKIPKGYFDTPIMSTESDEDSIFKEWRLEEGKEYKPHEVCSKYALNIYPICEYAKITKLPNDIQIDWLYGAEEAINLADRYFDDPYRHARHTYINEWVLTRNFESIQNFLKEQKTYLAESRITVQRLLHHAE